jgi:hypothetical protein
MAVISNKNGQYLVESVKKLKLILAAFTNDFELVAIFKIRLAI